MFAWLAGGLIGCGLAPPAPRLAAGLAGAAGGALGRAGRRLRPMRCWPAGALPAQRTVLMLASRGRCCSSAGLRWPLGCWCCWRPVRAGGRASTLGLCCSRASGSRSPRWPLLMASEPRTGARRPDEPARGCTAWLRLVLRSPHCARRSVAMLGLAPLSHGVSYQHALCWWGALANLVAIPFVTLVVHAARPGWCCVLPGLVVRAERAGWCKVLAAVPGLAWRPRRRRCSTVAAAPAWGGGLPACWPRWWGCCRWSWRLRCAGPAAGCCRCCAPPVARPAPEVPLRAAGGRRGARHGRCWCAPAGTCWCTTPGRMYSPESDAGQRVLLPLLRARGETSHGHLLVLSHRDSDHTGGAAVAAGRACRWRNCLLSSLPVRAPACCARAEPWPRPAARASAGSGTGWALNCCTRVQTLAIRRG